MFQNKIQTSLFYPACKVKGCDGILKLKKNDYNMTISFQCEKNYLHNKQNIKLNQFLNEYLKEYNYDDSNIKCLKHGKPEIYFCNDCKKNLCEICLNENICNNHPLTSLDKFKLSKKQINYLKKSFEEKRKYNKDLSLLIEKWKNELIQKLDELKQDLEDEIKLIEKLISNYNTDFINLSYHKNILNIKDQMNNNYNQWLNDFYYSKDFCDKIYCMYKYFYDYYYFNNHEMKLKQIKIEKNIGIIKNFLQIKNNYFFGIESNGTANLYNYNKNEGLNLRYKLKIGNLNFQKFHH